MAATARRTRPFGLTRLRLRRGRPRAWPSWRLPARLQRVSPRAKRAAAVNHLARFGAHARALQPHLQAMTQCATAPPLAAGVLQGSKRTVQASRARCAHRRSLACVAFWQLQDRHFANCRRQTLDQARCSRRVNSSQPVASDIVGASNLTDKTVGDGSPHLIKPIQHSAVVVVFVPKI